MLVNIHRPSVFDVRTHDAGKPDEFHVIALRDNSKDGGTADIFISQDWSEWDALVEYVWEYRDRITRHPEMLAG